MKKNYWVMKDLNGATEWVEITGKQFYDLVISAAGKGRYFMDCGTYKIEVLPEQYRRWKNEANRSNYLRRFENEVLILSLDSLAADSYNVLMTDLSVNIEDEVVRNIDFRRLTEAIQNLANDERWLIKELFLCDNPKTEQELAELIGISQQAVSKRKNKILEKLKLLVVKK